MSLEALGGGAFLVALAGLLAWFLGRRSGAVAEREVADLDKEHAVLREREVAKLKEEAAAKAEGAEARRLAEKAAEDREVIKARREELSGRMRDRAGKWGGG